MAYSVLQTGKDNQRMLYCSIRKKAILKGTETEMFEVKEVMERGEQAASDKRYFAALKRKYLKMLMVGGHSKKEANEFLKTEMPFLYEPK